MVASAQKKPSNKTTAKKTVKKTSVPSKKKSVSPVAKKTPPAPVKSPVSKKSSSSKKNSRPRKAVKKSSVSHFQKVPLKEEVARSNSPDVDTTMFTTILAVFIVAFVVLAGYIYARRFQKLDTTSTYQEQTLSPQRISVAAGVALNPQIVE